MIYKAEFNQLRNDLYWNFYKMLETDKGYEFFNETWTGYNDDNWWNNVAPFESIRTVTGDKGTVKVFKINFKTCEVEEVENE